MPGSRRDDPLSGGRTAGTFKRRRCFRFDPYRRSRQYGICSIWLYAVREKLVELQKQLAAKENVIMDGRDIGTCVLPDAPAKIYLTASVEVRAVRRYKELLEKGMEADLKEIEKDIEDRDYRDMHREHSPLKQAEDAVLLDTSSMTLDQVVEEILKIVREKGYKAAGGCA